MTLYMLDTNIVSDMMRNPAGTVDRHIAKVSQDKICLSIITAAELKYGAVKAAPASTGQGGSGIGACAVLPLAVPAHLEYGRIRAELEVSGQPIGPNDLLIAAQVQLLGATVVTANLREFERVPDLNVENWIT